MDNPTSQNAATSSASAASPSSSISSLATCREIVHNLGHNIHKQQVVLLNVRDRSNIIVKALWYITGDGDKVDPLILPEAEVTYLKQTKDRRQQQQQQRRRQQRNDRARSPSLSSSSAISSTNILSTSPPSSSAITTTTTTTTTSPSPVLVPPSSTSRTRSSPAATSSSPDRTAITITRPMRPRTRSLTVRRRSVSSNFDDTSADVEHQHGRLSLRATCITFQPSGSSASGWSQPQLYIPLNHVLRIERLAGALKIITSKKSHCFRFQQPGGDNPNNNSNNHSPGPADGTSHHSSRSRSRDRRHSFDAVEAHNHNRELAQRNSVEHPDIQVEADLIRVWHQCCGLALKSARKAVERKS